VTVSIQAAEIFDMERFSPKKLSSVNVQEQYQVKILNTYAELDNLSDSVDISN
jgi:hypothetical protein